MRLPRRSLADNQPKSRGRGPSAAPATIDSLHSIERAPKTRPWNATCRPGKRLASTEYSCAFSEHFCFKILSLQSHLTATSTMTTLSCAWRTKSGLRRTPSELVKTFSSSTVASRFFSRATLATYRTMKLCRSWRTTLRDSHSCSIANSVSGLCAQRRHIRAAGSLECLLKSGLVGAKLVRNPNAQMRSASFKNLESCCSHEFARCCWTRAKRSLLVYRVLQAIPPL